MVTRRSAVAHGLRLKISRPHARGQSLVEFANGAADPPGSMIASVRMRDGGTTVNRELPGNASVRLPDRFRRSPLESDVEWAPVRGMLQRGLAVHRRRTPSTRRFRVRRGSTGQSLVEFSLVLPLMLFLVVAIADFGRIYTSAVAVESAAREAADFGSFHASYWDPANRAITVGEMRRRACVAAAGSHLEGYAEPEGTEGHRTCTNPEFSYTLEPDNLDPDNLPCWDPATEPPCVVHVRMDYDFKMILSLPPLPATLHIQRDIRFRMADLTPP